MPECRRRRGEREATSPGIIVKDRACCWTVQHRGETSSEKIRCAIDSGIEEDADDGGVAVDAVAVTREA